MATVVTMHEAKTCLSKLIARAEQGEDVVIARGRQPVARLVPFDPKPRPTRRPGTRKSEVPFDMAFFDPLPDQHLRAWEGDDD